MDGVSSGRGDSDVGDLFRLLMLGLMILFIADGEDDLALGEHLIF